MGYTFPIASRHS